MAHFFWGDLDDQHKYHLANWGLITRKKEFGGLHVPNLRDMNLCLLGSWFKRFFTAGDKIWRKIIEYKYDTTPNICWAVDNHASPFWKGIVWAAPSIRTGYCWKVGNGRNILSWLDTWFCDHSLATLFWDLFTICNEPNATIADVSVAGELHLFFRRCFDDSMMKRWQMLYDAMLTVSLSNDFDTPIWHLDPSGVYSVQSFYRRVNEGGVHVPHLAAIWKIQIPGCVQVFLWLLAQNRLLTSD
jgi:hypothetical protein